MMAYLKPAGVVGAIHRYYTDGFERPKKHHKVFGRRAARRAWDGEDAIAEALEGEYGTYIDAEYTAPAPLRLGAKA